jgi:hypothetical protein
VPPWCICFSANLHCNKSYGHISVWASCYTADPELSSSSKLLKIGMNNQFTEKEDNLDDGMAQFSVGSEQLDCGKISCIRKYLKLTQLEIKRCIMSHD